MTYTFTHHEIPQSLASIMRHAWSLIKSYTPAKFAHALRMAWALARKEAGNRLPPMPANLFDFLRSIGGIKPCPELAHIHAPLHTLNRAGLPIDYAARLATDAGFAARDCANALLDLIRNEIFGAHEYAAGDLATVAELAEWDKYHNQIMEI